MNPSLPLAQPKQKVTQGATTRTHIRQEAMEDRGTCLGFRSDDISTVKKKKHEKNKKHKKHKTQKRISKTWFSFVDRAYVGTKDRDVLYDQFGNAGEAWQNHCYKDLSSYAHGLELENRLHIATSISLPKPQSY